MNALRPEIDKIYGVGRDQRHVVGITSKHISYRRPNGAKVYKVLRLSWASWVQKKMNQISVKDA